MAKQKQQILVVHGGGTFIPKHGETVLDIIQSKEPKLEDMRRKSDWKSVLQEVLGAGFDILTPRMPNADMPRYVEWKTWFEKILPLLDKDAVFIGHSLGGMFLAKYFSESPQWEKAKALFLVAPPYDYPEAMTEKFGWTLDFLASLPSHTEHLVVWHSKDDFVVPFSDYDGYKNALPNERVVALDGYGHFLGEEFPEIIEEIKNITQ